MTQRRDLQPEVMDDPALDATEHLRALRGLGMLNSTTGVGGALFRRLQRYVREHPERPLRVLDVATGGGDLPIQWARLAARRHVALQVTGVDISQRAVDFARDRARAAGVEVGFLCRDCLNQPLPEGFDVVTCSLFCHHLTEDQIVRLLRAMTDAARRAVLVCDLERSRLNLAAVWCASRLLSRSPVVHTDATLSVRAALTRDEFRQLAERALSRPVHIESLPPCRFVAVVDDAAELAPAAAFLCP